MSCIFCDQNLTLYCSPPPAPKDTQASLSHNIFLNMCKYKSNIHRGIYSSHMLECIPVRGWETIEGGQKSNKII